MNCRIGLLGLVLADGAPLVVLRPRFSELAAPRQWLARTGPDRAAAQLAGSLLWVLAAALAVGLLAALIAHLPGAVGRAGERVAVAVLPRAIQRLVAGSAGLGLLLTPLAAGADSPSPTSPVVSSVPAPGWPVDPPPPATPSTPVPPTTRPTTPADTVTVRPGDSLWLIAARRLGPSARPAQVAAAWPRWFAANRDVIGPDADRLVPGQVLRAPAPEAR